MEKHSKAQDSTGNTGAGVVLHPGQGHGGAKGYPGNTGCESTRTFHPGAN